MTTMTWRSTDPTPALQFNRNNNARAYPAETYKQGLIFRAFRYKQAYTKGPAPADQSTMTDIGPDKEPLCAQNCFFIGVSVHQGNYTAVPPYTHQGNGLANKPSQKSTSVYAITGTEILI